MSSLVDAAWLHGTNGICYAQEVPADQTRLKVLEVFAQASSDPEVDIREMTLQEFSRGSKSSRQCYLRLVVITRSWRFGKSHEKLPCYSISQEDFTKVLDSQGLSNFFRQTRADVVGLFTNSVSHLQKTNTHDSEYFALIYDAYLGLWAKYDYETSQWQGIFTVMQTRLSLEAIGKEYITFIQNKTFLYLFAAKYTVDFLGFRLGELPRQVAEIERHSGHHDSVLRPVPAIYEKLEIISAKATATANLVTYYKIVVSHIADELLQHLEGTNDKHDPQAKDIYQNITYLRKRARYLSTYLSYLERRTERQITASFHLLNQANAAVNLETARDMKLLALASKHDSSSMKILTAVTTIFLPGAFVATLFSTNMFNWFAGDSELVVSERFWIYWSVTIPLTLITVGIWSGWELWTLRKATKHQRSLLVEDTPVKKHEGVLAF